MKASDIGNIIDNFLESTSSAIIFDGNWGIGKTYAIEKLLNEDRYKKEIYDYCKIHYISLFGFQDIEILHKELYKKFHPFKARSAKALSYISLAISLGNVSVGLNGTEVRNDIEGCQAKESLAKQDYNNVIIFDDIERVATKDDGFIELFGYFNRLVNEGIKIIAICNSDEMEENNREIFKRFKEKIFDRTYTTNENNIEVIEKIFGETFDLLDDDAIRFFDKNLRFVKKSKLFIDDVMEKLSQKKELTILEKRKICLICILIIKEVFTENLSASLYKNKQEQASSSDSMKQFSANLLLEKYGTDEFTVAAIESYLQTQKPQDNNYLVSGLYKYFKYYDSSLFNTQHEPKKKILSKSLFYYSDTDKVEIVKDILDKIYNHFEEYDMDIIYSAIYDLFHYGTSVLKTEDYDKIVQKLLSSEEQGKKQEIIDKINRSIHFKGTNEYVQFGKLLNEQIKEKEYLAIVKYFSDLKVESYDGSLSIWTSKLQGRIEPLNEDICQLLKEKKFFLPNLSETITENAWDFCHDMCHFILNVKKDLTEGLVEVLDEQIENNSQSVCLRERVEVFKSRIKEKQ